VGVKMFLDNKYTKWYYKIIEHRLLNIPKEYKEEHHIMPKSLGGLDAKYNLVYLTAREHFLCHWLLTKMVDVPKDLLSLNCAFFNMSRISRTQKRKYNSRQYDVMKRAASKAAKIRNELYPEKNPFNRRGKENINYGKTHSEETKQKISIARKRNNGAKGKRWYNDGTKSILCFEGEEPIGFVLGCLHAGHKRGFKKGSVHSEESRQKMSDSHQSNSEKSPWNKGKVMPGSQPKRKGRKWATNGLKNILLELNQQPPEGYVYGLHKSRPPS